MQSIAHAPEVPVHIIRVAGQERAAIIGWFVHGSLFARRSSTIELDTVRDLATLVRRACGRFIVLEDTDAGFVVTLDPSGLLPVVFDRATGAVASSPAVLLRGRELEPDHAASDACARPDGKVWLPFGMTPFLGVERLLPGHSLQLDGLQVRRLPYDVPDPAPDESVVVRSIATDLMETVRAFASGGTLDIHLTAGRDSRMVLAIALAAGADHECLTVAAESGRISLDVAVARRLARIARSPHRTVPFVAPQPDEVRAWRARTGMCIEDAVTRMGPTVESDDTGRVTLTGTGGEIARAFYWRKGDVGERGLDPEDLVERLGFRSSPQLVDRAACWLDELGEGQPSALPRSWVLDRAYIEVRLGCWGGPSVYGHRIALPTLSPFNSRRVMDEMARLPEQYRLEQRFTADLIGECAEQLLKLRFNAQSGIRRVFTIRHEVRQLLPERAKLWVRRRLPGRS